VHPRQRELPPEIGETRLAGLADAEIDPDEALLYVLGGEKGSNGYGARYLHRHLHIDPEGETVEIHPFLDEMNHEDCIDTYRTVVFTDRTIEGIAALIRHELEHARQREVHGQRVMELYGIAEHVIAERVGGLAGGGFLYQVIPVEMDANAAAAVFVRDQFDGDRIDELLRVGDKDSSAFRSLVGPPPIETLPERMIRFFATIPDLCDRFADRNNLTFTRLLDAHWRGAGDVFQRLLRDDELKLPRH
jgi:hypothetical protein